MNRRRFMLTSGSAVLASSSLIGFDRPAVGLEFEISSVDSVSPSNINSVLIEFERMDIVAQYLDDSKSLSVKTELNIEDTWKNSNRVSDISFNNGNVVDLTDETSLGNLIVDVGSFSEPVARGKVKITVEHEDIEETYSQSFNIKNSEVVVDSFEDNNISEYSGDTGNYQVKTDRSFSGDYALYNGGNNDTITSYSGLDNYPQPGDTIRVRTYHGDDEAGSSIGFGFDSGGSNGYRAGYHAGQDYWVIYQYENGSANDVSTVNDSTPKSGQWWEWIIDWSLNNKITFTVLEDDGSQITELTHDSSKDYSGESLSFTTAHQSGNHDHWWDIVTIE